MQISDLKTYAAFGKVFWTDSRYSESYPLETLSAVSLLKMNSDRTLEKATGALLVRAKGTAGPGSSVFYRLSIEERFILVALHIGHWSYARLIRILTMISGEESISRDRVEELAWSARLQVVASGPLQGSKSIYPSGPSQKGPSCPDYDPKRPWTQRFLDDEILSPRDRLFLQNHLMVCISCQQALNRCRDFYYKVDQQVVELGLGDEINRNVQGLEKAFLESPTQQAISEKGFIQSLVSFSRRWDVRLILVGLVYLILRAAFITLRVQS